jgi:predicted phage gp36 major capsid-like protein
MPKRVRPSPPATKADIEQFANLIGGYCIRAEQKIDDLEAHMTQWKVDLRDQVQLMMDELRRDLGGANRDEIEMLKDRLNNVEQLLHRII